MGWIGWLLTIVGLIVAGYTATIIAGGLYPSRPLAVSSLRKELTKANISPSAFSPACLEELADNLVRYIDQEIQFGMKSGPVNSFIEETAQHYASMIEAIVCGDSLFSAAEIKEENAEERPNWLWSILAKHHPERFSLEHLEKMQNTNALLRDIRYKEETSARQSSL